MNDRRRVPADLELRRRAEVRGRWPHLVDPVPEESAIRASWIDGPVRVAVYCAVYDQVALVEDALRGFLTQRTTFPFEVIVRDDASTDGSQDVIRRYAASHPGIVRAVLEPVNRRSTGGSGGFRDVARMTSAEFLAFCEGDDFWVDPSKLQRQVEALDADQARVLCLGSTLAVDVRTGGEDVLGAVAATTVYRGVPTDYHHTSTIVARRSELIRVADRYLATRRVRGDTALVSLLVHRGRAVAVPGVVSVYWVNGGGVWSSLDEEAQAGTRLAILARLVILAPWRLRGQELARYLTFAIRYLDLRLELQLERRGRGPAAAPRAGVRLRRLRRLRWVPALVDRTRRSPGAS